MTDTDSLIVQAKRLTAVARALKENESDLQADGRFATALQKLSNQLPDLETQLSNRSALVAAGISVAPLPDLQKPVKKLREHIASIGRPSPQFMTSRSTELAANVAELKGVVAAAWTAWALEQIASLDERSLPSSGLQADQARQRVEQLRDLARSFSVANLHLFTITLDRTRDLVARIRQRPSAKDLLARIREEDLTLSDLTDTDVAELRATDEYAALVRLSVR